MGDPREIQAASGSPEGSHHWSQVDRSSRAEARISCPSSHLRRVPGSQEGNTADGRGAGCVCIMVITHPSHHSGGWRKEVPTLNAILSLEELQIGAQGLSTGQVSFWSPKLSPTYSQKPSQDREEGRRGLEMRVEVWIRKSEKRPCGAGLYSQKLLSLGCAHSAKLHWPGLAGHPAVIQTVQVSLTHFTRKCISMAPSVYSTSSSGVHTVH